MSDEYENPNQDESNTAARTLSGLAIISAVVGIILLIAGWQAPGAVSTYLGIILLSFALSTWILLLIFWAWRWERRTHVPASPAQLTAETIAAAIRSAYASADQTSGPASGGALASLAASTPVQVGDGNAALSAPPDVKKMKREAAARTVGERVAAWSKGR